MFVATAVLGQPEDHFICIFQERLSLRSAHDSPTKADQEKFKKYIGNILALPCILQDKKQ